MNKIVIAVILIVVVVGAAFYFLKSDENSKVLPIYDNFNKDTLKPGLELKPSEPDPSTTGPVDDFVPEEAIKTFIIDSSHLRFYIDGVENPDIIVNEGDKVRIEFSSSEGFHDWNIDEFNAATQKIEAGGKSSVTFVANKKGNYEYYCSVGQHRQNGMKGKFIVQ
ncbi:MAG: cupredoxin domain-containing protein [Nanoarchaeota archaeon]